MSFYTELNAELVADPLGIGYDPLVQAGNHAALAAMCNDKTRGYSHVVDFYANARILMSKLGAVQGAAFLDALSAVAVNVSAVKWAMSFLTGPEGINIGDPQTRGMINSLVAAGALTTEQGTAVLALALEPHSRAETLFGIGRVVTVDDIALAIAGA